MSASSLHRESTDSLIHRESTDSLIYWMSGGESLDRSQLLAISRHDGKGLLLHCRYLGERKHSVLLRHYFKMKFAVTLVLFTVFCFLEGALGYPLQRERQQGESHHSPNAYTSQSNYKMHVYIAIKESC